MNTKYPIHYSGAFTKAEIDDIITLGYGAGIFDAKVLSKGEDVVNHNKRKTDISWIQPVAENLWLFTQAAKYFTTAPITMMQAFQFSVYQNGGHYRWHRDIGNDKKENSVVNNRVLAGVLQLTSPKDYSGGQLKIDTGDHITKVHKECGMLTVFPAGWRHKVDPVKKGVRRTLVMWGLK